MYDQSGADQLDTAVLPVPDAIRERVFARMAGMLPRAGTPRLPKAELSYNRSIIEQLLEHDLVSKETATYHLLVDRFMTEKREAEKEAGATCRSPSSTSQRARRDPGHHSQLAEAAEHGGGRRAAQPQQGARSLCAEAAAQAHVRRRRRRMSVHLLESIAILHGLAAAKEAAAGRDRLGSAGAAYKRTSAMEVSATSIDSGMVLAQAAERRSTFSVARPNRKTALLARHSRQTSIESEPTLPHTAPRHSSSTGDNLSPARKTSTLRSMRCCSALHADSCRDSVESAGVFDESRHSIVSVTSPDAETKVVLEVEFTPQRNTMPGHSVTQPQLHVPRSPASRASWVQPQPLHPSHPRQTIAGRRGGRRPPLPVQHVRGCPCHAPHSTPCRWNATVLRSASPKHALTKKALIRRSQEVQEPVISLQPAPAPRQPSPQPPAELAEIEVDDVKVKLVGACNCHARRTKAGDCSARFVLG